MDGDLLWRREFLVKLTPALVKAVQSKGGAEVGALLAGALKQALNPGEPQ